MNYDKIILEMLSRIQALEDEVKELRQKVDARPSLQPGDLEDEIKELSQNVNEAVFEENADEPAKEKTTTADIRAYIEERKHAAKEAGEKTLVLRASEIHQAMKLKKRYPMVCHAMRQCMEPADTILHETPSGYSSSLEIMYGVEG